jgi:molybdenum cofactor guanylyltransferase
MDGNQQAAGFVLIGGASARMGRDKALLELGGVPLLLRTARMLEEALDGSAKQSSGKYPGAGAAASAGKASASKIRVIGGPETHGGLGTSASASPVRAIGSSEAYGGPGAGPSASKVRAIGSPEIYGALGVSIVADDWPGAGPLGGIATALRASQRPWNLIVACDLPYLTTAWLIYLLSRAVTLGAATFEADAVVPMNADGPEPLCAMYHKRAEPTIVAALNRGDRKVKVLLKSLQIEAIEEAEWKAFDSDGLLFKNMNTPADYDEAVARIGGSGAENRARS